MSETDDEEDMDSEPPRQRRRLNDDGVRERGREKKSDLWKNHDLAQRARISSFPNENVAARDKGNDAWLQIIIRLVFTMQIQSQVSFTVLHHNWQKRTMNYYGISLLGIILSCLPQYADLFFLAIAQAGYYRSNNTVYIRTH